MRGNELIKKIERWGRKGVSPSGSTRSGGREVIKRSISGTEDHHPQPEGRVEDWHLPRDAEAAWHQREGIEMNVMNCARDLRIV